MKNNYKNLVFFILALFIQQAQSATISLSDRNYSANINDIFTLDIIGQDFTSNVDGGGVNIIFDPAIINVLSVSIDNDFWDFMNMEGTINNTLGTVNGIMVNALSSTTDNFTVASIEFQAITGGTTNILLNDFSFNPWSSGGETISTSYVTGQVTVSNVPIPATAWLFGSALIGLTQARYRSRK